MLRLQGINLSPAASAIGISVLAFAIIRYRVFELVPIGRDRAIEVMTDGYLFVGPNETVLDANPAAADLLGKDSSADLQTTPVREVVPVYDTLAGGNQVDLEIENRVVEVRQSEVTQQNQAAGDVLLLHDVTEQRQQKQKLEDTNERLDRFASVVSHDLRNPLHVAKGNVVLAREEHDSEQLAAANNALERMETLVKDLLTLAREGESVFDPEPISLSSVVNDSWAVIDSDDATLTIESELNFVADRGRLQQLLENLFRNAVEHGGNTVTIRVGALPDAAGFYVADDGPGIPVGEREQVFDSRYSTTESGTGYGLTIVEEIVDTHGWSISIAGSTTQGARFEVTGVTSSE
jgi:signal transduction histidine kinase